MPSVTKLRWTRIAAVVALALAAACGDGPTAPTPVASVDVSPATRVLVVGQQVELEATPKDASGDELEDRPVAWRSADASVATVTSEGVVTAVAPGTTDIIAASEGREGRAALTVNPIPVAEVRLSVEESEVVLEWDGTFQLGAVALDAQGRVLTGRQVEWMINKPEVATISESGLLEARGQGTAIVGARIEGQIAHVGVRVRPVPVHEVRLGVDDVTLEWAGTRQLAAVVLDPRGHELSGRLVEWQSSRPEIVTVDETGMLQARREGSATVTALVEGKVASVGVQVRPEPVAQVALDLDTQGLELGDRVGVRARLLNAAGAEVSPRAVVWTSSAPGVATATSTDAMIAAVEALAVGRVTITASAEGKSASFTYDVTPRPTHDLIYSRFLNLANQVSEIFVLGLSGDAASPIRLNAGNVSRDPSPSPNGSRYVFAVSQISLFSGEWEHDLYVVDRNGMNMKRLTALPGVEEMPAWSPDGTKIVFRASTPGAPGEPTVNALWVVNVDGTGLTNLTPDLPTATYPTEPAWSHDGRRIAFVADAGLGHHKIWTMNADGTDKRQVTTDAGWDRDPTWSPDGTQIAFSRWNAAAPEMANDIMIVPSGGGTPRVLALPGDQFRPAWSPDGYFIAFSASPAPVQGIHQIYTMHPDGTGVRLRTSNPAWGGGSFPSWIRRP